MCTSSKRPLVTSRVDQCSVANSAESPKTAAVGLEMEEIRVIELRMMDRRKYYPLTLASGLCIRSLLYPFMLIKTRLQIQRGTSLYKGTFDAFVKISTSEGVSGLYRGFWVSCLQLFPSMSYITSYEWTRHHLAEKAAVSNTRTLSFLAGGTASIVGQTMAVPLDIVTQHLMLMGRRTEGGGRSGEWTQRKLATLQTLHISEQARHSRFGSVAAVVEAVYQQQGVLGFYKGYFVSLMCFAPNSALWWWFYDIYSGNGLPAETRQVIDLSKLSSGTTSCPVDCMCVCVCVCVWCVYVCVDVHVCLCVCVFVHVCVCVFMCLCVFVHEMR